MPIKESSYTFNTLPKQVYALVLRDGPGPKMVFVFDDRGQAEVKLTDCRSRLGKDIFESPILKITPRQLRILVKEKEAHAIFESPDISKMGELSK